MKRKPSRLSVALVVLAWSCFPRISAEQSFTLIVIPDTQYYADWRNNGTPEMFYAQTRWIADNAAARNIKYVLHVGDIVNSFDSSAQWTIARNAMYTLYDSIPYALVPGNHDGAAYRYLGAPNMTTKFNTFFPYDDYKDLPTFGGYFNTHLAGKMDNTYHFFSAGGVEWMILALEFGPHDSTLIWANNVVQSYPDKQVIILTHAFLNPEGEIDTLPSKYYRENSPLDMWNKLVRKHANISLVFNGHDCQWRRRVETGDNGNKVYMFLSDYSPLDGGNGYLRIYEFYPQSDKLVTKTYSPHLDSYLTDPENQFEITNLGIFSATAVHRDRHRRTAPAGQSHSAIFRAYDLKGAEVETGRHADTRDGLRVAGLGRKAGDSRGASMALYYYSCGLRSGTDGQEER